VYSDHAAPEQPCRPPAEDGWQVVHKCKQWCRVACQPPPPPHQHVPSDLVGQCFNCHQSDHIAIVCPNAACCLHCHDEGHQACNSKMPCSPVAVGSSPRPAKTGVVLNLWARDVALVIPHNCRSSPSGSCTLLVPSSASMLERPLSCHILPSPLGRIEPRVLSIAAKDSRSECCSALLPWTPQRRSSQRC
jgi:hypothetical protein